ncbi:hypothetical protein H0H93_010498 [Arthromyces matolae]|nr:hypothetical protein H0H93_010498 [Arthromyces matolae]
MGWDPISISVPRPPPDLVNGHQHNNPGYCFLTFPSAAQAAQVLAQIKAAGNNLNMPNSSQPFVLNWASTVQGVSSQTPAFSHGGSSLTNAVQQYPKEYSIFVGDLAPETSNSDLVAVFRNPVLGLRNDREPKFIRPFLSCKSAKIMLDPVTGISRGYGFVRFSDEADQQRALIEMHGLYCLSRPMRISPATAKYKGANTVPSMDIPQVQYPAQIGDATTQQNPPVTVALPLPNSDMTKSVSVPIAASVPNTNSGVSSSASGPAIAASSSNTSLGSGSKNGVPSASALATMTPEEMMNLPNSVLAQIAQQYASGEINPPKASNVIHEPVSSIHPSMHAEGNTPRYNGSDESWKHQAQARAILGNLIGPNGEQLTSTDPYNTTVFVGGLSPLISEETLRTFFIPFGDIHYVKVPVGKHCGFVQFVRKADAERAIEKMQGFPIGGSRIRLSWGRSQYKAAQAAAQAAQAAALQNQYPSLPPAPNMMTQEQAMQLLQKLHMQGYLPSALTEHGHSPITNSYLVDTPYTDAKINESLLNRDGTNIFDSFSSNGYQPRSEIRRGQSSFAPFSPDPNAFLNTLEAKQREMFSRTDALPHPSKAYAPGFFPLGHELKVNTEVSAPGKPSPTSVRPNGVARYNAYLDPSNVMKASNRPDPTISRPASGQTPARPTSNAAKSEQQELDSLKDLNSTLASLDLDRPGTATDDRAQLLLDTLQMLLDVGAHDDDARPPLLNALLKLSQHWELHPQSLNLPDVDRDEDPASDEGFLVLYKARLRNRVVGIKITTVLNPTMQSDLVKQYFREALTWSQLSHPNVQPFYGIHCLKDRLNKVGLVSCWLQNGNVLALLQKNPNIDRSLIVTDVAQGMSYLHSNNIIHGDIRTANVLIRDDDRACLADFGLTSFRAIHDQEDSAFLASISGVGTVRYQAPELFEDDDLQRNMATDVFAFSMFCFEIYAGFPPFSEITPWLALMTAIRQGKRPELTASMSRLGGKDSTVLELMRDCWDQNPHRRPSAQHIVARLPLIPPAQSWGVDSSSQVRRGLKSCITSQSVEDTLQSLCSISKS